MDEEILNKIFRRGEGAGAISGEKVFLAEGTVPWGTDKPGIFTTRTDRKSKEYDFWVGLPLYSKLIVDNKCFIELGLNPTTLDNGLLEEVVEVAKKYSNRCDLKRIPCVSSWTKKQAEAIKTN